MKKIAIVIALLSPLTCHLSPSRAQAVVADGFDRLQVAYKTAVPELRGDETGRFRMLSLPGYTVGGEVGAPALPVRSDVIEVPFCNDIKITVENAVYDTLQFPSSVLFYPLQPSRSKSDTARRDLAFNKEVYSTDAFWGQTLAEVQIMGVARDRRLAQLRYSPVQMNPVTGQVVVCRSADITVTYVGSDVERTLGHYRRYHTQVFSVGATLNNLFSDAKTVSAPVRMVIAVPNVLRCSAVDRFAQWKRRQGFLVDVLYYQDLGIATNSALAEHLTSLYTNATEDAPAPTFLLLVGDHGQLPAFESELPNTDYWSSDPGNDHITDLYFTTWTSGDNLPDCYQGRFSAVDTSTLNAIVNKTLYYEQYSFLTDSYLARAALIAGEDNAGHTASGWNADYAWVYADPTMDYIAYNYVNADNGYNQVTYYKNDTSYAPVGVNVTGYCSATSAPTLLRNLYNTGIGWINYSAHGDWDGWHKPSFKVSDANSMNNLDKPSFMIGNCCLTSKFDKPVCFAEALLRRRDNAGAVAYIGGTNSTYWAEDFYWSVGLRDRNSIRHNMSPTYDGSRLGVYDRLFHTHAETYDPYAITAGSMIYYGNLSVNSSSSSDVMKKYYWEIYELMGDPSLMPWMGRADYLDVSLDYNDGVLSVVTAPHAYVALVDTGTFIVQYAAFADEHGHVACPHGDLPSVFLSINAQNYRPYSRWFSSDPLRVGDVMAEQQISVRPNPASDRVVLEGLPLAGTVKLYDIQGRSISETKITGSEMEINVSSLPSGLYLLQIQTPTNVSVKKVIINQ